jgi:glutamate racemase
MIAVFDSGLGGLSVLQEMQTFLPDYNLWYVADTAFCPYGPKPIQFIQARSLAIGRWFAAHGAAILVVACNTASSAALSLLREALPIPVIGMEPGLKPAAAVTRNGRIGVLATSNTLAGARFGSLIERFAAGVDVWTQPCPKLVQQVEAGRLNDDETRALVEQYVRPLLDAGVDTLVLGCTHFPFLRPLITAAAGPDISIIDTGPAVARQVARVAKEHAILPDIGHTRIWTTGTVGLVAPNAQRLLGRECSVEEVVIPE